jgi:hypothetical protein
VSPKRWLAINTVIVAIQGWLAGKSVVSLSRTYGIRQKELARYMSLMGADGPHVKRAMLKRLLWNLIDSAVRNTGLGIIGDCEEVPPEEVAYLDFTEAYRWDEKRYYFETHPQEQPLREVEEEIQNYGQSGTAFLSYVKNPLPPFCQQKLLRYQQVALFRIADSWSDPTASPPGGIPRSEYEALFNTYVDAISRWYEGIRIPSNTPGRSIYERVFRLLGERTECKRAVIDCLVFRSRSAQDLQEAAIYWLKEHTMKLVKP